MTLSELAVRVDAHDLRQGGSWTPAQSRKNAVIRVFVRAAVALADRVPRALLLALGSLAGTLAWALLFGLRRQARSALVEAGIASPARVARRCFTNAGRNLARCLLARRSQERASNHVVIEGESLATLESALLEGKGVVFVSAHAGPFEWIAPRVTELGHAASIVVRESYDPDLDPIVDAHRALRGVEVIHRGRTRSAFKMLRALRAGRALGVLPDLPSRAAGVPTPFLGAERPVSVGPARLARAAACPLLTGVLLRRAGRFHLHVRRVAPGEDDAETTRRVMADLEAAIRNDPEHWLWMAARPRLQKNWRGR